MDNILGGLNPAQREAVETTEGPILILAGAGSGKTKTLTHRIANLISQSVAPERILAVTFTNKAAKEMRERLFRILYEKEARVLTPVADLEDGKGARISTPTEQIEAPRGFMPYMGTFHGIAVRFLRIEAEAAGLDKNFVIYDVDDQITLIRRILKELKITDNKTLKPKMIQSAISNEKNQGNGPEEYEAKALYPNQKQIARVFYRYEEEKMKAGALDFDDLLLKELEILQKYAEIREKWQKKFQHILIDEYQDTNAVQYNIVKLLVNKKQNICVVGDDWQSIYSWRGADFTNILNFTRDFPNAKVVKLEQNYRSTGNILKGAQKIIRENKTRTDKELFTEAGDGEPIDIESLRDETEEANYVGMKILSLKNERDYGDFAILYRTNAQSYAFEKAFISLRIPYKIVGGVRFYDRKEIKDVLAILKVTVRQRDKVSLARIVANVLSGIGEASLAKIFTAMDALRDEKPLFNADLPEILSSAKAKNGLMRLINFLKTVQEGENPGEVIKRAIEYFDFKSLLDDGTKENEDRMGNLEVLVSNAAVYETTEEFLADATLMSSADESAGKDSVTLMTLHAAKGLEFPVVFIVGLEEGLFPSGRVQDNQEDLEEERRLMYVGMTRAMKKLFLTYAASRFNYGERAYNIPSRFLTELGYNPYGSNEYRDEDGDGFLDDEFKEDDFSQEFPEDLPVFF